MENSILSQIGITQEELIERIIDKVLGLTADYKQVGEESWEDIPFYKVVDAKIESELKNIVETMKPFIEERIETIMTSKVEEVFSQPFQPLNRWGEPVGEKTTIKDLIADQAQSYWKSNVDEKGQIFTSNSYGNRINRAEYYAKKVMTEFYDKELVDEVKKMSLELKNKIPQTISDEISKTVLKYIK